MVRKWEYLIKGNPGYYHILNEDELNQLGEEGWELVGFSPTYGVYIFKREKTQDIKATDKKE